MRLLFLFQRFSFQGSEIYADLLNALLARGHQITALVGTSRPVDDSKIHFENGCEIVYFNISNQFGVNKFKKGLIQLMIEPKMMHQLMRHLRGRRFDAVVYPTPPITLANVVKYCREEFGAESYLMLKDIFPQNAVDLGMMRRGGICHRYFSAIERRLYRFSDHIGCMSPANLEYMRRHLPPGARGKLELFPNTIRISPLPAVPGRRNDGVTRFVFGGNLGKPQAIDFLLNCLLKLRAEKRAHFDIIGAGSESARVQRFLKEHHIDNAHFSERLPREEYARLVMGSDVGLVLLSHDFTIPNYPSRILSYMQQKKAILAATDDVSDVRQLIECDAKCGFWCSSADEDGFVEKVRFICDHPEILRECGENGYAYLCENFSVERSVGILEAHFSRERRRADGRRDNGPSDRVL